MADWKEYRLGEVLTVRYGKDHKTIDDGDIPIYGSGGIMRYGNRAIYDKPSVLIPRKGSLNNIMYVDKPFWSVDTMFWTQIDEKIAIPKFLFYSICNYDFASLNVGSAVPSMSVPLIENVCINIPSIKEQGKILSILSALDDKIETNRRINAQLEELSQALFKSWFIDFDSFGGQMPDDWETQKMDNLIVEIAAGPFGSNLPKSCFVESGVPIIDGANLKERIVEESFSKFVTLDKASELRKAVAHAGDFVVTISGTVGQIAYIAGISNNDSFVVSQRQFRFKLDETKVNKHYISLLFSHELGKQKILAFANQTGVPALSQPLKNFKNIEINLPTLDIQNKFGSLIEAIDAKICKLNQESARLAALRDALLPKLMSGELIPQ